MRLTDIYPVVESFEEELIAFRRKLHSNPELAYNEFQTATSILEKLKPLPDLEIDSGIAGTGIRVVLRGAKPGPVVALRADMDALPIIEESGLAYQSKREGVMHACGHDGHTTCLLGAVLVLYELRAQLRGTVVFLFQPAEELEFGARRMIEFGVLKNPDVEAIFGLHAWPDIPVGTVAAMAGPVFAGYRDFDITVRGQGAHAAMPDRGIDPIVIAAHLIVALQSVVSRSISPASQLVLTVGSIAGGKGRNVIPNSVTLAGTTRFYDRTVGEHAREQIELLAHNVSAGFGGTVEFRWFDGAPPVVNDLKTTNFFNSLATTLQGGQVFQPVMASEDFSYYMEDCLGTFWGLGVGAEVCYPLHHPKFNFADDAIRHGVALHAAVALNFADCK